MNMDKQLRAGPLVPPPEGLQGKLKAMFLLNKAKWSSCLVPQSQWRKLSFLRAPPREVNQESQGQARPEPGVQTAEKSPPKSSPGGSMSPEVGNRRRENTHTHTRSDFTALQKKLGAKRNVSL